MKILVVEDDPVSAGVLVKGAEVLGHACRVVADGDTAWALLSGPHDVDVVVSAWVQPGLSGRDLCLRVRERSARYLPFIFHTAASDRAAQLQGMRAGADDWLRKPLDLHDLELRLVAVERLLSLHRRLETQADELRRLNGQLERQLRQDVVTGIPNRRRLEEDGVLLYERAAKLGLGYSVAMIDVDQFKAYNDTYGHARGDEALRAIAARLTKGSRASDQVYRYGGEEFVLVLQSDDPERAHHVLERVRRDVERLALPHAGAPGGVVTVSIGIATMNPAAPRPASDVIDRADAAMYRAKRLGRNRVVTWDPVEDSAAFTRDDASAQAEAS